MFQVAEIFASIQGESSFAGFPCTFVRLTGCPLRCRWCDTRWAFTEGVPMSLEAIIAQVDAFGLRHVEVTGGEPLAQAGTPRLLGTLSDRGCTVLLETSGALDIGPVPEGVHVIMDLKAPLSGEEARNRWENLDILRGTDEIKIVLAGRPDYLWARDMIRNHNLDRWPIAFSPIPDALIPADLAAWMVADRSPARLQIQLHKIIWPKDTRGV